ncbi:hypothetical protein BPOR_0905g00010 [Botrytis porri]|uniref:Zn(2)-C6 fungal-type domain-containing protein n=1 Tax=Botrytis porri TaxID=87229 RepID=A0A4Z1KD72_9HELO|nr:hypothetical protein BPOR_0905g00010 [Botrytis porri]
MMKNDKREFEDLMPFPADGNVYVHVNNDDEDSHESMKPPDACRRSLAKVKTGCNNCKARRVKCDETKPACMKCQRSGRVCDRYPALDERWKPENHMIAVSASGMSANNERHDTSTPPLANERDYRLEDTVPRLSSIKEQLPEDDSGRVSQMLSPAFQFHQTRCLERLSNLNLSLFFNFVTPQGLQVIKHIPIHFHARAPLPKDFSLKRVVIPDVAKDPTIFFQLTRHEKLHLCAGIFGEEDYSTQFTVEPAPDESSRPRNLGYTILNKATADPLASVDHGVLSAQVLQDLISSENNGSKLETSDSAISHSTTARHPKCSYCDYEPSRPDQWKMVNLTRHTRETHTTYPDRLHCRINYCRATFSRSGNLKAHQQHSHGIYHDVTRRRRRIMEKGGIKSSKKDNNIVKEAVNIVAVDVVDSKNEELQAIQARSLESFESDKQYTENHRGEEIFPHKDHPLHQLGHRYCQEAEILSASTWPHDDQIITEQLGRPGCSVSATDLEVPSNYEANFNDMDSSVANINQNDWIGLKSTLPRSDSITQDLPQAAKEEILTIICTDSELQLSLSNIASKISKPRFVRNIRRLLQLFILDLRETVTDTREKDAVNILEQHAPWFAARLFDFSNPNRDADSRAMASYLDQQIDTKLLLEQYLASSLGTKLLDAQIRDEAEKIDTAAMEVHDLIDIDYSNFPNVKRIKKFISGGSAFEALRLNTSQFARNELPGPSLGNTSVHIEPKSPSHLETNHFSNIQRFRWILAKQARIVFVLQRFLKLMKAQSILHSYFAVDQAKPNIFEIVSNSSENNSSDEKSSITTSGDIESDTNDTDYDSGDLPDDAELSASAEEQIANPKAYFDKLKTLEQQIFNNSGLFIHKTGDSTGPAQNEALLCLTASEYHKTQTDYYLDIIKHSDSELLLDLLVCHNRAYRAGNNLTALQENGYCAKYISLLQ